MRSGKPGPRKIIYCLIGIAILIYSGHIVWRLVMHIWHKAPAENTTINAHATELDRLFKVMQKGLDTDYTAVVYNDIDAIKRRYDFHKTKSAVVSDSQNLCVSCHGDIPHLKDKKTRSFQNMHAFFMACETCHIRPESGTEFAFVWYDKVTGQENDEMDLSHFLANTPYKLKPVSRDDTTIYASDQMKEYVARFKTEMQGGMDPAEKRAALEVIHQPVAKAENIVSCEQCHSPDPKTAYLPFQQIGYPQRRAQKLGENEVVGMLNKYKTFYMPDLFTPKNRGSE